MSSDYPMAVNDAGCVEPGLWHASPTTSMESFYSIKPVDQLPMVSNAKKSLMFLESKSVGHAGQVIADGPW